MLKRRDTLRNGGLIEHAHNVFLHDLDVSVCSWLNKKKFKKKFCCSFESVNAITNMINDHDIFKKEKLGPNQTPVKYQLMVLLNFIGHESKTD